jgi:hypothetical protein
MDNKKEEKTNKEECNKGEEKTSFLMCQVWKV